MIVPKISWKENEVLITYNGNKLCYNYSSLPDRDLNIAGVDLDEFNAMLESIRYDPDPKKFVRNFTRHNHDPPGFQRCRALALAQIYSTNFRILSMAFCTLAFRYNYNGLGSIDELERFYKDLQGFKEFEDHNSIGINYRWTTSIWAALAHCYVKEGNGIAALELFNKVHSFAHITLWPSAMVNVLGSCYATGQSVEYSKGLYEAAIKKHEIKNIHGISEIIHAAKILEAIMGKPRSNISDLRLLYVKANDLLKNYI